MGLKHWGTYFLLWSTGIGKLLLARVLKIKVSDILLALCQELGLKSALLYSFC